MSPLFLAFQHKVIPVTLQGALGFWSQNSAILSLISLTLQLPAPWARVLDCPSLQHADDHFMASYPIIPWCTNSIPLEDPKPVPIQIGLKVRNKVQNMQNIFLCSK